MKKQFIIFLFFCFLICQSLLSWPPRQSEIEEIRKNPKIINSYFEIHSRHLSVKFNHQASQEEMFLIFCNQIAYQMAPYGRSFCYSFPEILKEKYLHCGNYGILATYLALQGNPNIFKTTSMHYVGWDFGYFGNHQTINVNNRIFIDPTCGLVAFISFDEMLERKKNVIIYDFSMRDDIKDFRERVKFAITHGLCKPEHLIYYNKSLKEMMTNE